MNITLYSTLIISYISHATVKGEVFNIDKSRERIVILSRCFQ